MLKLLGRLFAPLVAACVLVALAATSASGGLFPQPFQEVAPAGPVNMDCPTDLGAGDATAWIQGPVVIRTHVGSTWLTVTDLDTGVGGGTQSTGRDINDCPVASTAADGSSELVFSVSRMNDEGPIFAVARGPHGPLGSAQRISRSDVAIEPQVALSDGGDAVATWYQAADDDSDGQLPLVPMAAIRVSAGGAFGAPLPLDAQPAGDPNNDERSGVKVGVDAAGNAIAVWSETRTSDEPYDGVADSKVFYALRPAGGAFGAPRLLSDSTPYAAPSLVVAPSGEALLTFSGGETYRGGGHVWLATGNARDGLAAPVRLARQAHAPAVAVAPGGAAVVGWSQTAEDGRLSGLRLVAVQRPAGGSFGPPHELARVSRYDDSVTGLALALASDGRVEATWERGPEYGAGGQAYAAHGSIGGPWGRAQRVSDACRLVPQPPIPSFGSDGAPRVTLIDAGVRDNGDEPLLTDERIRVVRFADRPAADVTPPRVHLTARRRQRFNVSPESASRLRAAVRCSERCDLRAYVVRRGHRSADGDFFGPYARLRAGRRTALRIARATNALIPVHATHTLKLSLVVQACDAAGNVGHASVPIDARIPANHLPTTPTLPPLPPLR
ncbi:MAG TPA: hypothetical protein VGM91_02945 [Conexibacter sp.]